MEREPQHLAVVGEAAERTGTRRRKEEHLRTEKTVIKVVLVKPIRLLCIFTVASSSTRLAHA